MNAPVAPPAPHPSHPAVAARTTHMAGEFFVAAELAKRGYNVSLTMGNAKSVDLFAERDGRSVCVQVKAIAHRQNVGWPVPKEEAKIPLSVVYVCVVLNAAGVPPRYFIMTARDVRGARKPYETRAILNVGAAEQGGHEDAWHVIEQALNAGVPEAVVVAAPAHA